jgi:hypothetical protein
MMITSSARGLEMEEREKYESRKSKAEGNPKLEIRKCQPGVAHRGL